MPGCHYQPLNFGKQDILMAYILEKIEIPENIIRRKVAFSTNLLFDTKKGAWWVIYFGDKQKIIKNPSQN